MTRAVILFGHGSRDLAWRQPMDAVAQRIAARGVVVRCAFLELQLPDLRAAADELVAQGATELCITPMFLGAGRHAREDLPRLVEEVRSAHPGLRLDVRPAVGEDPRVLDLLAAIAGEGC
jgi:sirohydrochlorin cobaltochelatase